ncbi:uncharacterized protein EI97DRAFT_443987 [Westerdykella ornata]|uniref:Uncharacterized protein n=1 Tax=Westerdykella ornata TaxID=318751 RepID=A0A6A6JD07_WESOR|nr:uncharacterized protein EI97DRAFT_443987 [Westerdykella ornata]KAF2274510.1 hypothetical protein EI97DRAFT_443987 [Westerdykella ornata]
MDSFSVLTLQANKNTISTRQEHDRGYRNILANEIISLGDHANPKYPNPIRHKSRITNNCPLLSTSSTALSFTLTITVPVPPMRPSTLPGGSLSFPTPATTFTYFSTSQHDVTDGFADDAHCKVLDEERCGVGAVFAYSWDDDLCGDDAGHHG